MEKKLQIQESESKHIKTFPATAHLQVFHDHEFIKEKHIQSENM